MIKLQWATPEIDKQVMYMAHGKISHACIIRFAAQKGITFDFESQELVTHTGRRVKPKLYGSQKYPSYTIAVKGKQRASFYIHKFAAYLLFGESALMEGVHVRHLDGDTLNLSKENIAIGSARDNERDKSPIVRSRVAAMARKSQIDCGLMSPNTKISDDVVNELRAAYKIAKDGRNKLPIGFLSNWVEKTGLSVSGVQAIVRGKYRKQHS